MIFTVLALAIQSAKFSDNAWSNGLELLAWAALLISGITGLSRMEWLPVAHDMHSSTLDIQQYRDQLEEAQEAGMTHVELEDPDDPPPIEDVIAKRISDIAKLTKRRERIEKVIRIKYGFHKWAFVLALVLLVAARGYAPARDIARALIATGA